MLSRAFFGLMLLLCSCNGSLIAAFEADLRSELKSKGIEDQYDLYMKSLYMETLPMQDYLIKRLSRWDSDLNAMGIIPRLYYDETFSTRRKDTGIKKRN